MHKFILYQYLLGKVSTQTPPNHGSDVKVYQYLLGKVSTDERFSLLERVWFVSISIR